VLNLVSLVLVIGGGGWASAFAIQAHCAYSGTATADYYDGNTKGVPAALCATCAAVGLTVFWLTAVRMMRALPELCRPKQWNGGDDQGGQYTNLSILLLAVDGF